LRLIEDSQKARAHYAALHAHCATATIYQSPAWLDLWKHLGAETVFVEVDAETMVPFVCRGQGALRRAFSLPFDTYGGPVGPKPRTPIYFENTIAPFGNISARVVDFGAQVASMNGAARVLTCHMVDLSTGYAAAQSRYLSANQRLIRQRARSHTSVERPARLPTCSLASRTTLLWASCRCGEENCLRQRGRHNLMLY
jgi:hypothetical protein